MATNKDARPTTQTHPQPPTLTRTQDQPAWRPGNYADKDGQFRRPDSQFRHVVSADPNAPFPAEPGRYVLYVNYGCPWAHRTVITRQLKGLEDVVELIEVDDKKDGIGWAFGGRGPERDPRYGFRYLRELYEKAEPGYSGKITVPVLWDTKKETVVNNESSEIIRMFYNAFDAHLPKEKREDEKGEAGLFPPHLRKEIEEMNDWVYNTVNNGVYKTGFATTQEAYNEHVYRIFESLDRLEEHLGDAKHQPYLFGENITEADIRLFTTLIRFDVAYFTIFKCNLKMIRYDYPRLHKWLRNLYWDTSERTGGAFHNTVRFEKYKQGYAYATASKIVPAGPSPHIFPL